MFSVVATGDALIYRWQKDDVDISNTAGAYMGSDTAMLTVLSVTDPEDEGTYQVVVANAVGIIASNEAMLSIRECNNYSCMRKYYHTTSSCARSARFATCARNSLRSLCHCAFQ